MGIGSILTGLAIYKPVQLGWLTAMFGGYKMARIIHFALTIGYVLFFLIHVIQVIIAGWNNFQAMVTGFEVVRIKEEPVAESIVIKELPIEEPVINPIVAGDELPAEEPPVEPVTEEPLK